MEILGVAIAFLVGVGSTLAVVRHYLEKEGRAGEVVRRVVLTKEG